ncbi:hypothetical protein TorRG33x02_276720 [Trema orientale]|uniref:Uncharacterized protein n=1 Tax=Trema orientale TaxID=63057 RepID=A0A2P5CQC8_TREOI|nr:hypothetical protein TorRG33x02_276720 [Trema orientale]
MQIFPTLNEQFIILLQHLLHLPRVVNDSQFGNPPLRRGSTLSISVSSYSPHCTDLTREAQASHIIRETLRRTDVSSFGSCPDAIFYIDACGKLNRTKATF